MLDGYGVSMRLPWLKDRRVALNAAAGPTPRVLLGGAAPAFCCWWCFRRGSRAVSW